MAKYQKYAEYKHSGIEWLGEIPSHWDMSKLRYLFNFSKGLTITKDNLEDEGIPCVSYGEVHSKYGFEVDPTKHPLKCVNNSYLKSSENALLNKGDFVFADTSEDLKGSGNFTHLVNDEKVFAGYHTVIGRPFDYSVSRFYAYLFDSKEFRSQIQLAVKGVKVFSITQAMLRAADVWLPSNNEKYKIANFLDYETAKIDNLIAKQKKLIELLKEKRQAVISHAVTKGLNPNVPMKDSGVEWLGKVPEHWEVRQLRYLGSCQNGINIGAEYFGSGSPFISYGDVYRNPELPSVFEGLVQSTENDKRIYSVQRGDVLFTRTSETIEEIGFSSTCLTDVKDATFAGFLIRFRPIQNTLLPEYSKFYFRNILLRAFFVKEMNLVTRASLSQELLKKLAVPFSSLEEQKQIADFLSAKERVFDKLVNDCIKQIELLKERRTALISSAVTGKINVSNWQHPNEAKTELSL
ncbi:restriction endonuclease subunit S [Acinetobacter johnsonii]|uniref:Restriction endonuclease subunit S n=1 Tax=Acinetobacter johnsonii TaxID=40214 RepID=A0AA42MV11_ACIJO|nr:restriction endonuclease subunit S [Acinetobacter johnsonii]MDH0969503.1 restriction endonuclease subunit S [Acinetobacter johnsonii]